MALQLEEQTPIDEAPVLLQEWLIENAFRPYPSLEEKQQLARITSIPLRQV